jgi:hypothetical protein
VVETLIVSDNCQLSLDCTSNSGRSSRLILELSNSWGLIDKLVSNLDEVAEMSIEVSLYDIKYAK